MIRFEMKNIHSFKFS